MLFTGEEQGLLGSRAYVQQHRQAMRHHLAAIVIDSGQGPVTGLSLGRPDLVASIRPFAATLASFVVVNGNTCGTDCLPFIEAGLPGINLVQSTPDFVALQHSAADTLDKIDPAVLARNSTVMPLTACWIADRAERWAAPLAK